MVRLQLGCFPSASDLEHGICVRPGAFWLDTGSGRRACFAGFSPTARLSIDRYGLVNLVEGGLSRTIHGDPLSAVEAFLAPLGEPGADDAPPRVVGVFSYELGCLVEPRFSRLRGLPASRPLAYLARYDAVVACEKDPVGSNPDGCRVGVYGTDLAAAERCASALLGGSAEPDHGRCGGQARAQEAALVEAPSRDAYVAAVLRAKSYIAAGDVYQVNLARRLRVASLDHPAEVFRRLRAAQPVPFGCFLDCGGFAVLSASPERFLRVSGKTIETEPIKGTRPRGAGPEADAALRRELERDAKERAEHVMIVDLERSDLGRVCETGSIAVPSLLRVESFATVHHMVSTVRGRLRGDVGLAAILRATFPGGSVTGAPKIRAVEIIDELEPEPRGVYTGALAWFRGARDFDSSIAIRTAIAHDGVLDYHVGAGIVADSDPEREYEECWLKARPFLSATLGEGAHLSRRPDGSGPGAEAGRVAGGPAALACTAPGLQRAGRGAP